MQPLDDSYIHRRCTPGPPRLRRGEKHPPGEGIVPVGSFCSAGSSAQRGTRKVGPMDWSNDRDHAQ